MHGGGGRAIGKIILNIGHWWEGMKETGEEVPGEEYCCNSVDDRGPTIHNWILKYASTLLACSVQKCCIQSSLKQVYSHCVLTTAIPWIDYE